MLGSLGLPVPCRRSSCPSRQGCFGACAFPEPRPLLSFSLHSYSSCDLSGPTLPSVWGAPPPSLPLSPSPSSTLSIPGWTRHSHCPFPGKGCLAGPWSPVADCRVGDLSPEESQGLREALPTAHSPQPTTHSHNTSNIFRILIF